MNTKSIALLAAVAAAAAVLWLCARPARAPHPANPAVPVARPQARPTPATPKPVPEPIRPILGFNHESIESRWAAIRALGTRLSRPEIEALYDYLRGHEQDPAGPMRGVLKNDVILALKKQQPPPADLAAVLAAMFYDKDQDPVIRNYALQHLATWYDRCDQKAQILEALWAGTSDADPSTVGTALIALARFSQAATGAQAASSQSAPAVDTSRLGAAASAVVQDSNESDVARATALQVCAWLQVKDVLPTAVALAQGAGAVPLRISAVAALGALGGPDEAALLNRLASTDDGRIQTAARAALRRLQTPPKG